MPRPKVGFLLFSLAFAAIAPALAQTAVSRHPMALNDVFDVKDVGSPEVSPEGKWVLGQNVKLTYLPWAEKETKAKAHSDGATHSS